MEFLEHLKYHQLINKVNSQLFRLWLQVCWALMPCQWTTWSWTLWHYNASKRYYLPVQHGVRSQNI